MVKTLSDKIYDEIVEDIINGVISTDSVLTENSLMSKFNVSRAPVREAMLKLCNEEIIYSIPRYGYKIHSTNRQYLNQIIELRLILETQYLIKNFDKIGPLDIDEIRSSIVIMDKNEFSNPIEYWEKTKVFHLKLAYSYRDKFFYEILKRILKKELINFSKLYWENWSELVETRLVDNHSKILNAIVDGKKEEAVRLLKQDIKSI